MLKTLRLALALSLLALTLDVGVGAAQPIPIAPTDILVSTASLSCVNTTSECSMFQWAVPAAYVATFSNPNAVVTQWYDGAAANGLRTPVLWNTGRPLHLRMLGAMAAVAGDNINIGVNFGGSTATLSLRNIVPTTLAAGSVGPVTLDVWVTPVASSTATPNATNSVWLAARYVYSSGYSVSVATQTTTASQGLFNSNLASSNQLNVLWRWGAASNSSSLTFYNRLLKFGE